MTFEEFCGGPFWDTNRTWYSSVPDVTSCFQQTILVWIPAFFLWVVLPFYAAYLLYQKAPATPRCPVNIAKMVVGSVLVLLSIIDIIIASQVSQQKLPDVYFVSPTISAATFTVVLLLMELERRKGFVTSGVLFLFWTLHLFAGIVNFYSHTLHLVMEEEVPYRPGVITFYIQFLLVIVQTILTCFSEAPVDPEQQKLYPEYRQSFLSRITYHWLTGLVVTGFRKPLEETDLWQLDPRDRSVSTGPELSAAWKEELQRSNWYDKKEKETRIKRQLSRSTSITGRVIQEVIQSPSQNEADIKFNRKRKEPSLFRAMVAVYGITLLQSHLCKLVCDILTFVGPLLQRELIAFTTSRSELVWKGYIYAILFFLTAGINAFFFQQLYHIGLRLGTRIRSAVIAEIYKKALTLSNEARRDTTVGEIVNLMSVDAQRLQDATGYLWMIWSSPLQITIAVWLLWRLLGVSVLAGLVLMLLLLPANVALATYQRKLQQSQMKHKDGRIKLMNDILNGMKVLKLYAWELSFKEKIDALRNLELADLRKYSYLAGVGTFTWTLAPFGVMLSTITTYVLSGHDLDAETAFVALSLFNVLHFPINLLPVMISNIITANVSIKRIGKFLRQSDLDTGNVTHNDLPDPITVTNATFSWGSTEEDLPVLSNINMNVPEGSFVAIVGEVGSGKSSLIAGLLGELLKLTGSVNVKGRMAYAAQEAWIQNATVRDNITFGKEFVRRKYDSILEACALKSDMGILPGGDMTEIGEKGINLSGGQRQRVSLARAAYSTSEADIFLLDDPLSAVDSHVGKHIFTKLLGKKGLLRNKTRIMVTHGLHWLPNVDHVIVLADGGISESGTYEELMSRDGPFARLVRTYLLDEEEDTEHNVDQEVAEVRKSMLQRVASLPTAGTVSRVSMESQVSWTRRNTGFSMKRSTTRQTSRMSRMSASSRRSADQYEMERFKRSVKESMKSKAAEENERAEQNKLIDKEKSEVGSVKFTVFLAYGRAMGLVNSVVLLMAFIFYKSMSVVANIWVSKWTSDNVFNGSLPGNSSQVLEARDVYLGVYGGLGLTQALFVLVYAVVFAIGVVRAARLLHNGMLYSVLRSPMAFFDTTPSGRMLNRFSRDVDTVDTTIPQLINTWMTSFFTVCSCVVVIAYSTPVFLCCVPPLAIIYYFIQRFYIPTSRQLKRLEATSRSPIFAHFSETINGASTIRAYNQQERFMDFSNDLVDKNLVYHLANITSNRWIGLRLDILSAFVVLGAALFAVIGRDSLTGGAVGLSISYALQATTELNWFVRVTSDVESNLVSVERVKEYSELPSEAPWHISSTSPAEEWPQTGKITFDDYATRYRPGLDLVLKGIAADIPGGQRVGIVGRTGAGKSSLTLGLFRIIEGAYGSITMDGVNIADIGLHQLRSRITILPQESMMFAGSLRVNLDPLGRYKDDELYRALDKAHLLDFVGGLPEELDYDCGEGGQNLSVGQRQLVGLARAMLHKSRVLVLDEATAAVDLQTDELIQATIRAEFADSTILTIAHRLNTIMDYDRIMVLDAGRVAEFAAPSELLQNKNGIFYSMAKDAGIVTEQNTKL